MTYTFQPNDWRTKAGIFVNAEFADTIFQLDSCAIRVFRFEDSSLECNYIIEAYCRRDDFPEIRDAYYFSIDRINEFLDQLSLISYFPSVLTHSLSTTHFRVDVGEEFNLIIPDNYSQEKNPVRITSKDLKLGSEQLVKKEYNEALRQIREGLSTEIIESKFLHFYAALERIAEAHTEEKIVNKCPKCGFEDEKGPATSNYLRDLFETKGLTKTKYNRLRGIRGKVAHGAGKRDIKFIKELIEFLPLLESTAVETVSIHTDLKIKSNFKAHGSQQFWDLTGIKVKERDDKNPPVFNVLGQKYSFAGTFSKAGLLEEGTDAQEGFLTPEIEIGRPLNIHPESWPD